MIARPDRPRSAGPAFRTRRLPLVGPSGSVRGVVGGLITALALALAGCGSSEVSGTPDAAAPSGTATSTAATSTPAASTPLASTPAASTPGGVSTPSTATATSSASSAISIPPYLCEATDIAQNAADAYVGALSAGNEKQAMACVLPGTVPAAVTRGLLAKVRGTAVYLPRAGVNGPRVFGYQGDGKQLDVTVTKERDGRFWVTGVVVRGG